MLTDAPPAEDRGLVAWLLLAAVATTAPHATHLPVWLTALCSAVLLWRGALWLRSQPLPSRWRVGLIVVAGVAGIVWEYRTLFGRDAGVALLALFMALKPMEVRSRRDAVVVVMLGYFLLLTHYFYSQSIPTGLWLLVSAAILTATLIRLHGGPQSPVAIFRYAAQLLVQALPLMLIAFVLVPRVSGPFWGLPRDAHSGLVGLSDEMSPGSLNNLIQSGAIAFRVRFDGPQPPRTRLYWRGPVLEDYDGQTWRSRPRSVAEREGNGAHPVIEPSGTTYRYVTTLEPHNQRWLLALDVPITLPPNSVLADSFEAISRERVRSRANFSFVSVVDFVANRDETRPALRRATTLPAAINPKTRELAADFLNRYRTPEAISDAILTYFHNESFLYTLRPPLLGESPIDDFLFNTRAGFCEHYASAYVFLMRSAGIPARVVTGYQGGEVNPVDGYLTVRQSDAHAWAEIWIAGKGWRRVDPTAAVAPSRIERGIDAALPAADPLPTLVRIDVNWIRALRFRWEAVNNAWNQWVIGYNPERQRDLLARWGMRDPDWQRMMIWLALLAGSALMVVSAWTLVQRPKTTPAERAWRTFCRQLAAFGIVRARWEGPLALAERAARKRPEIGEIVLAAAQAYAEAHYGVGQDDAHQLQRIRDCAKQLGRFKRRRK